MALATQVLVFPLFGVPVDASAHVALGAIFAAVSLVRSYLLWRVFERLRR